MRSRYRPWTTRACRAGVIGVIRLTWAAGRGPVAAVTAVLIGAATVTAAPAAAVDDTGLAGAVTASLHAAADGYTATVAYPDGMARPYPTRVQVAPGLGVSVTDVDDVPAPARVRVWTVDGGTVYRNYRPYQPGSLVTATRWETVTRAKWVKSVDALPGWDIENHDLVSTARFSLELAQDDLRTTFTRLGGQVSSRAVRARVWANSSVRLNREITVDADYTTLATETAAYAYFAPDTTWCVQVGWPGLGVTRFRYTVGRAAAGRCVPAAGPSARDILTYTLDIVTRYTGTGATTSTGNGGWDVTVDENHTAHLDTVDGVIRTVTVTTPVTTWTLTVTYGTGPLPTPTTLTRSISPGTQIALLEAAGFVDTLPRSLKAAALVEDSVPPLRSKARHLARGIARSAGLKVTVTPVTGGVRLTWANPYDGGRVTRVTAVLKEPAHTIVITWQPRPAGTT